MYEGSVPLIPFSCDLESRLSLLPSNADREALLKELGTTSVLPKIVVTGYKALQLIYFFTAGEDEVRAWTIRVRGSPAPSQGHALLHHHARSIMHIQRHVHMHTHVC